MARTKPTRADKALSITRLTNDYYLLIGGGQWGPLKIGQLWELYWSGRIHDKDLYWTEGLTDWMPIPALYHSRGFPYGGFPAPPPKLPTICTESMTPENDGGGFLRRLLNRPKTKNSICTEPTVEHFARPAGQRCSQCNGPAHPKFYKCLGLAHSTAKRCGTFCRQCMQEMCSRLEIETGCPLCGGGVGIGK